MTAESKPSGRDIFKIVLMIYYRTIVIQRQIKENVLFSFLWEKFLKLVETLLSFYTGYSFIGHFSVALHHESAYYHYSV